MLLGIGEYRSLIQLTRQLGQLRVLIVQGALGFVEGGSVRLNLSLERNDLKLLDLGEARSFVQLTHEVGQLRFCVGQDAVGFVHGGWLDRELLRGAQWIAYRVELDLEPVDRVALFAQLRK